MWRTLWQSYSSNTGRRTSNWVVVAVALFFPCLPFVTRLAARINSQAGRHTAANWIAALPMTLVAGLFGLVLVWAVAMDVLMKLHI